MVGIEQAVDDTSFLRQEVPFCSERVRRLLKRTNQIMEYLFCTTSFAYPRFHYFIRKYDRKLCAIGRWRSPLPENVFDFIRFLENWQNCMLSPGRAAHPPENPGSVLVRINAKVKQTYIRNSIQLFKTRA